MGPSSGAGQGRGLGRPPGLDRPTSNARTTESPPPPRWFYELLTAQCGQEEAHMFVNNWTDQPICLCPLHFHPSQHYHLL